MGSGFKTFTAGSVLTASDVQNYLQTQAVMYFASTTARDAAITSPVAGMVAYIDAGDATEGLYTYNGTAWRQGPGWNAPWGIVPATAGGTSGSGYVRNTTTQGSITTEVALTSMTITFTAVANRLYQITQTEPNVSRVGGVGVGYKYESRFRYTNTSGTLISSIALQIGGSNSSGFTHSTVVSPSAGSTTIIAAGWSENGTMQLDRSSTLIGSFWIADIGPAGAPA